MTGTTTSSPRLPARRGTRCRDRLAPASRQLRARVPRGGGGSRPRPDVERDPRSLQARCSRTASGGSRCARIRRTRRRSVWRVAVRLRARRARAPLDLAARAAGGRDRLVVAAGRLAVTLHSLRERGPADRSDQGRARCRLARRRTAGRSGSGTRVHRLLRRRVRDRQFLAFADPRSRFAGWRRRATAGPGRRDACAALAPGARRDRSRARSECRCSRRLPLSRPRLSPPCSAAFRGARSGSAISWPGVDPALLLDPRTRVVYRCEQGTTIGRAELDPERARLRGTGDLGAARPRPLGGGRLLDRGRLAGRGGARGRRHALHRAPAVQGHRASQRSRDRGDLRRSRRRAERGDLARAHARLRARSRITISRPRSK